MAWTTPKTYSSGAALTASELNTYQRDNQEWLKDALTTNDIVSDTVPVAHRGCLIKRTTSFNFTTSAVVVWQSEEWDSDGFWSAANAAYIVIPAGLGGDYLVGWSAEHTGALNGLTGHIYDASWVRKQGMSARSESYTTGGGLWLGASAGDAIRLDLESATSTSVSYAELWISRLAK